jgi:coenzyme PQQ synthesis protein D (PqqD)
MRELPQMVGANRDVILTEMNDGTGVLLNMRTKFYYTINETAVFLWKSLDHGARTTPKALAEAICCEFDVDLTRAEEDVRAVICELLDEELLAS